MTNSDTDTDTDPEELLQQSKTQTRHTSEPITSGDSGTDRVQAIETALRAIEDGDAPENINLRDDRLKALLVGLDEADELADAASRVAEHIDDDLDVTDDVSQSELSRLLLRVGLQASLPRILEDAKEARKQLAIERADNF